ncbi:MAG: hypothetical protein FWD66_01100 [Paludibacter sp.]|nr:hypothetical protein [Paludibacter sp.]
MAAILDFSRFNFSAEQIRAVNELIFDDVLVSPELQQLCTVYPGIVYDKEIGFIGEGGLLGVASQGCNPTPQNWQIATRKIVWEPKAWEILLEQCYNDLESTAAVYSLRTGVDIADFTDTDYMRIIFEVLTRSIKEFIIRLAWFNDIDSENFIPADGTDPSGGGNITPGVDVSFFNILDGFWKQIALQVIENPEQLVTITENSGATLALQTLSPVNIQSYLQKLVYGANILLRDKAGTVIPCTQSFYDAYEKSLAGINLETMYSNLVNGQKTLTFNGIPLIRMPFWDKIIRAYYKLGAVNDKTAPLYKPHRAIFMHKDYFAFGVDGSDSFDKVETWYNRDKRVVKIEAMGKADAKLINPLIFNVAM